ncbi:MAG: hypothetical protein WCK42_00975 [Myxococcaceae bacterium]
MSKIFILVFLFSITLNATDPCTDPFAGEHSQFSLTEPLSCNSAQAVYQLQISQGVYLEPSCIGNNKVVDLYLDNGQKIQSFSTEQVGQPGWGTLTVESACTGKNLFTIKPDYQVPDIGFVNPAENTVNNLILRNNQSQIIANATKHFVSSGNCGQAIWSVENNPALSPQVMAYLLALKDNNLFSCSTNTPGVTETSDTLSPGAIVGIALSVTAVAIVGSVLVVQWVSKHRPKWLKRSTGDYQLAHIDS